MSQVSSLKTLKHSKGFQSIPFTGFPGAKECLTDLSTFGCHSYMCSNFFSRLFQTCQKIQRPIVFESKASDGVKGLISLQRNLKQLELISHNYEGLIDIIPTLTKHQNTVKKLYIQVRSNWSLSEIYKNLLSRLVI